MLTLIVICTLAGCGFLSDKNRPFGNDGLVDGTYEKDTSTNSFLSNVTSYELNIEGTKVVYTESMSYSAGSSLGGAKSYMYLTGVAEENSDRTVSITFDKMEVLLKYGKGKFEEQLESELEEMKKAYENGELDKEDYELMLALMSCERTEVPIVGSRGYTSMKVQIDAKQERFLVLESENEGGHKEVFTYYENGVIKSKDTYKSDIHLESYRYDENGEGYDGDEEIKDENGKLLEVRNFSGGIVRSKTVYYYDVSGILIKKATFEPSGETDENNVMIFAEYSREEYAYKNGKLFSVAEYLEGMPYLYTEYADYDKSLISEYREYDSTGSLSTTESYTYYESGNIKTYQILRDFSYTFDYMITEYPDKKDTEERIEKVYDKIADGTVYLLSVTSFDENGRTLDGEIFAYDGTVIAVLEVKSEADGGYKVSEINTVYDLLEREEYYSNENSLTKEIIYRHNWKNELSWWSEEIFLEDGSFIRYFLADGTEIEENQVPDLNEGAPPPEPEPDYLPDDQVVYDEYDENGNLLIERDYYCENGRPVALYSEKFYDGSNVWKELIYDKAPNTLMYEMIYDSVQGTYNLEQRKEYYPNGELCREEYYDPASYFGGETARPELCKVYHQRDDGSVYLKYEDSFRFDMEIFDFVEVYSKEYDESGKVIAQRGENLPTIVPELIPGKDYIPDDEVVFEEYDEDDNLVIQRDYMYDEYSNPLYIYIEYYYEEGVLVKEVEYFHTMPGEPIQPKYTKSYKQRADGSSYLYSEYGIILDWDNNEYEEAFYIVYDENGKIIEQRGEKPDNF